MNRPDAVRLTHPGGLISALPFCLALAFSPRLTAQPALPPLSLQESVREALVKNPDILRARAAVKSAEGQRLDAGILAPANPELELRRGGTGGQSGSSSEWRIAQEFWLPGQRHFRKAAAQSGLDAARWDLAWAGRRLSAEVIGAFAEVRLLEEKEAALSELAELNGRLSAAAEMRFKAGDISFLDNSLLQIETRRSRSDALKLRREAAAARERLGLLLGRDLPVQEPLLPLPEFEQLLALPDDAGAAGAASRERPDVAAAQAQQQAAERDLRAARLDRLPRPTLFAGETRETGVTDSSRQRFYGVSFSIPLFNWNRGAIRQAGAILDRAQADAQAARQESRSARRQQMLAFETEADSYRLIAAVLPDVRANLALLEKGYRAGQLSLNDMLLQKDRLYRALIDHADTAIALIRARADLAASEGDFSVFQLPLEVDTHDP